MVRRQRAGLRRVRRRRGRRLRKHPRGIRRTSEDWSIPAWYGTAGQASTKPVLLGMRSAATCTIRHRGARRFCEGGQTRLQQRREPTEKAWRRRHSARTSPRRAHGSDSADANTIVCSPAKAAPRWSCAAASIGANPARAAHLSAIRRAADRQPQSFDGTALRGGWSCRQSRGAAAQAAFGRRGVAPYEIVRASGRTPNSGARHPLRGWDMPAR